MNVKPKPKMRDTWWNGRLRKMIFPDGTLKGMKQVLIDKGVNVTKMKADEMREVCMILNMRKPEWRNCFWTKG